MRSGDPRWRNKRGWKSTPSAKPPVGPQVLAVLKTILPRAILALDAKTGKIAAGGRRARY